MKMPALVIWAEDIWRRPAEISAVRRLIGGAMRTRTKDPDGFIDGARRDRRGAFTTRNTLNTSCNSSARTWERCRSLNQRQLDWTRIGGGKKNQGEGLGVRPIVRLN
jgi:hypothetical protein